MCARYVQKGSSEFEVSAVRHLEPCFDHCCVSMPASWRSFESFPKSKGPRTQGTCPKLDATAFNSTAVGALIISNITVPDSYYSSSIRYLKFASSNDLGN